MIALQIVAEAGEFTLASLVAAMLFDWCFWNLFKLFHHPEWGPPLGFLLALALFGGRIASNEFLRRTAELALLAAGILWAAGRNRGLRVTAMSVTENPPKRPSPTDRTPGAHAIYPAIVACVGEGRMPNHAEIRKVAKRMRRETYPDRPVGPSLRRAVTRAALAALGVPQSTRRRRNQGVDHVA